MTANLLAHAPHLFCCGVARSGAYNRTLTPFGFQVEGYIYFCRIALYALLAEIFIALPLLSCCYCFSLFWLKIPERIS